MPWACTIPVLGAMSGTLNLAVFVGDDPGVVGRIQLTRGSGAIPGLTLSGQFLLEINTFSTTQTIQTFMVEQRAFNYSYVDAQGNTQTGTSQVFNGLAHDAAGRLVIGNADIGTGFNLLLAGTIQIGDQVTIDAAAQIIVSPSELSVVLNGTLALGPLGTVQVVNSGFRISSAGLVANMDIRLGASFGASLGLKFNASVLLQLNTTGQVRQMCIRTGTTGCSDRSGATTNATDIAPGFLLDIRGSVTIAFIKGSGFVRIRAGAAGFEMEFGVDFGIGGLAFSARRCGRRVRRRHRATPGCARHRRRDHLQHRRQRQIEINTTTTTRLGVTPRLRAPDLRQGVDPQGPELRRQRADRVQERGDDGRWLDLAPARGRLGRLLRPGHACRAASTSTTTATSTSSCTAGWCSAATTSGWSATSTSR